MIYDARDIRLVKKPLEIPANDKSEELLSYVILASIELLCGKPETAGGYIESALNIATLLEKIHSKSLSLNTSKFACFTCESGGTLQVLPLPIINNVLILPELSLEDVIRNIRRSLPAIVNIRNVSISYFRIRLNLSKLVTSLDKVATAANHEAAIDIISTIIKDSLGQEIKLSDPLELASDYFFLARNLIKKGNVTLTRIALANAYETLEPLLVADKGLTPRQYKRLQQLKSELRIIAGAIGD